MSQYEPRQMSGYGAGGSVPPRADAPGPASPQGPPPPAGSSSPPPPLPVIPLDYRAPDRDLRGGYFGPAPTADARTMGMLCHLLGLLTSFLGPLILWLVKKDDDPFIDHQGKEALNFQLTVLLASFAAAFLSCFCFMIFPLSLAVFVGDIVFCILAMVDANRGVAYRYPVSIRFVS